MIKFTIASSLVLALGIVVTGAGVLARQGGTPPPAKAIEAQEAPRFGRPPSRSPSTS